MMSSSIMPVRRAKTAMVPPPKKRRKTEHKVEEVVFNVDARQDYLSGFHKRKLQRQKQAKVEAAKREREDKLAARKSLREGRKADLEKHMEAVNAVLEKNDEFEDGASLIDGTEALDGTAREPEVVDREDEYVDEDKLTTVTVEAVDVDRDGMKRVIDIVKESEEVEGDESNRKPSEDALSGQAPKGNADVKRKWMKDGSKGSISKPKKRKFKYEGKADRKITRFKERGKGKNKAKERKGK